MIKKSSYFIKILLLMHLPITYLSATDTKATDCFSTNLTEEEQGCQVPNILESKLLPFKIREEKPIKVIDKKMSLLNITETLSFVQVKHETKELIIKRTATESDHTCPPFCIQPMTIGEVKTIGEVEVLKFIETLKEKKSKLLIDTRSSKRYKENTIPGAINIPFNMLEDDSKYQKKILTLLGATKEGLKWKFKTTPTLLLFGNSNEEDQASKAIKKLLKLSYPSAKLLYYRGGVSAWKHLGLTLY